MVMIMMMVKFIIFPERSSPKMAVGRGEGGRGERGARGKKRTNYRVDKIHVKQRLQ